MKKWKLVVYALASVVLFLLSVEVLLTILGVAPLSDERDPFSGFSRDTRVYRLDDADGVYRTRPRAVVHSFHMQEFAAHKPDDGFRLFVLGGSSAFGFPWGADVAFPRSLGLALEATATDRFVESVNAAAMSYGSHRLRILAGELLDYEPDALVIYGGHNEFIERRFYRDLIDRRPELDFVRALLHRWRLFSSLTRVYERNRAVDAEPAPGGSRSTGELLGLDVIREDSSDVGEAETEMVRATFEENLRAIVADARQAGVAVLLCTLPSNLRDWRPNQSYFDASIGSQVRRRVLALLEQAKSASAAGEHAAAGEALERAVEAAPGYAEAWFRLGRAYEHLDRWKEADLAYRRARDSDGQPSRAPEAINRTIRTVARETGVILVDVERIFVEASPHGILGFDLFEDYVHPKPSGHRLIARKLWRVLLDSGLTGQPVVADAAVFSRAVAELDSRIAAGGAGDRTTVRQLFNLAIVLENQGLAAQAMEKYGAALEREEDHHAARHNLARLLAREGRLADAEREYLVALETARGQPMHASILLGLGDVVAAQGRVAEASELYADATEIDPRFAPAWGRLGNALAETARHADAAVAFGRALDLDPQDVEALSGMGFSLLFRERIDEATTAFRSALAIRPDHLRSRNGLAATLTEAGRLDEAERIFREVLEDDPADPMARGGLEVIARRRMVGP